jgi:2',3'-cyclic-nucleotide 2'-phosphodiesterase (5'-nucleotidase family)
VTILYTADEHGWLLPTTEKGEVKGGAAEMLGRWVDVEGHCVGAACERGSTLALSGGDNWTGPAISSYFQGVPIVEAMRRMGYAASAFGNHEFDFGRDQFSKNREAGGFVYLAANVELKDGTPTDLKMPAFTIVERAGIKIGVVGLATESTPRAALASRFEGIVFANEEQSLARAIPQAWAAGPDALVLIAHECPEKLEPVVRRHPEWKLSFVGLGHCHKQFRADIHGAPVIAPGWRFRSYARVRLEVDPNRPPRERVTGIDASVIDVTRPEAAPPAETKPDAELTASATRWKKLLDDALGQQIGFTTNGLDHKSPELGRWIAESWRQELGADLAIVNDGGVRQGVPPGPITMASVYSVLPFDNRLLLLHLRGRDLLEALANKETIVAGLVERNKTRIVERTKAPIDPNASYTLATIDFLYFGGDGYRFQTFDPNPKETGLDWRTPVIEWTRKLKTTDTIPLEKALKSPEAQRKAATR